MRSRSMLYFFFLIFVVSPTANAKKQTAYRPDPIDIADSVEAQGDLMSDANYQKLLSESKKEKSRSVAATDVSRCENQMPEDFRKLRAELVGEPNHPGLRTPAELDSLITRYSDAKTYAALSPEAQFVVLQLKTLSPYKSAIFRLKGYVGKYAAIRVVVVSMLRAQAAAASAFYPVTAASPINDWDIVFKYMTEPQPGMGGPIDNDAQLYGLITQLAHHQNISTNELEQFIAKNKSVWWDNRIYAPFANFTSDRDRCVHLEHPELLAIYSSAAMASSSLTATSAYSLNGLHEAIRQVAQLNGVDVGAVVWGEGPQGVSSLSRTGVIRKYPNLFVKVKDGDQRMKTAFDFLVKAVRAGHVSYEETKRLPAGQDGLFDARAALAFSRQADASFAEINALLSGNEVESTVLNGEKVRVNIHGFYTNPPERLQDLLPIGWVVGKQSTPVQAWGRAEVVRNYRFGMAATWNVQPYKTIFPDIETKDGKSTHDLPRYARVLSQTWGASAFAIPLTAVIF